MSGAGIIRRRLHATVAALVLWWGVCGCEKPAAKQAAEDPPEPQDTVNLDALRSLPYTGGFPSSEDEPTGVVLRDPQRSCPGYNLYTIHADSAAELIDEDGRIINSWSYTPRRVWEHVELLPNGDLLVVGAEPGMGPDGQPTAAPPDETSYILRFNWKGRLLWKRRLAAHHDIEVTPGGKLLVLTFQRKLVSSIHRRVETRDGQLTLLEQDGTVIESHSMLQAAARNPDALPLRYPEPSAPFGAPWIDVFHSNSVEWMHHEHLVGKHPIYDPGNILVCLRQQDCVAVFNWARNEAVWSWGKGEILGPHDAQVLENGHILLFDNGTGREYSRAVEMDPLTGQIVWQYKADPPESFYSFSRGSAQRLPNGNTLLSESDKGRAFEVTPDGEIVWEFICPYRVSAKERASIVRMKRFPHRFIQAIIDDHAE